MNDYIYEVSKRNRQITFLQMRNKQTEYSIMHCHDIIFGHNRHYSDKEKLSHIQIPFPSLKDQHAFLHYADQMTEQEKTIFK
jgi:tRNA U34 2-thiouridine synthase MnmA/TrmU